MNHLETFREKHTEEGMFYKHKEHWEDTCGITVFTTKAFYSGGLQKKDQDL